MAYSLGSSSGFQSIKDKFDTKAGKDSLQHFADAKKSLCKLNEVTIGSFNEKTNETAKLDESAAGRPLTRQEAAGATVLSKMPEIMASEQELKKGNTALNSDEMRELAEIKYASGEMSAEEFASAVAYCDAKKANEKAIAEANREVGLAEEALNGLKSNFCASAPFAACASCPNRVKKKAGAGFDLLGELNKILDDVMKGLEDAALAILGCPGLVNALKNGDFEGLKKSIIAGGTNAIMSTALDVGSGAICGGLYAIDPKVGLAGMKVCSAILSNGGGTSYTGLCKTMDNLKVTGDQLMKAGSIVATTGNLRSALTQTHSRKSANTVGTRYPNESGALVAAGHTSDSLATTVDNRKSTATQVNRCLQDALGLDVGISCKSLRTRARHPASRMASLPNTTIRQGAIKNGYAIDYLRTGRNPPKDVKVRKRSSVVDVLA